MLVKWVSVVTDQLTDCVCCAALLLPPVEKNVRPKGQLFGHTDLLWTGRILLFNPPSWNEITTYFWTHNLIVNSRELSIPKTSTARDDSVGS